MSEPSPDESPSASFSALPDASSEPSPALPSASSADVGRELQRRTLRLVANAQALPTEEQEAYVSQESANDAALGDAARELLARIGETPNDRDLLGGSAAAFAEPLVRSVLASETRAREYATESVRRALEGRYALGEEIGRGGSAIVYLARDVRHGRRVAVKVIALDAGVSSAERRFSNEIKIAARLQHPYIVSLFDSGEADGALYYVMPYVAGETLRQRLDREGMLALQDVATLAHDIAEALDAAHAQGVVHRDIKPSNILLRDSHALVADFGIALSLDPSATRMTSNGMVLGTPHYMSPEQAVGESTVDSRSDIYSFGCLIYEMLAGEVPFPGASSQAVRAKHLHAAIPDVTILRPTLPPAVHEVLARALAKAPADRFASAGALVHALRDALVDSGAGSAAATRSTPHQGVHLSGSAPAPPQSSWVRRRLVWGAVAATAIAAIGWTLTRGPAAPIALEPLRMVLFPLERHGPVPPTLNELERLRDAVREWRDLEVVDAPTLRERLGARDGATLSLTASRDLARSLGAGHFARGSVSADSTNVWLRVMLYSSDSARMEAEASVRIVTPLANLDATFVDLVHDFLFNSDLERLPRALRQEAPGTHSYVAYTHFLRGQLAASSWDLATADREFALARDVDREFRQAWLWLGLSRRWAKRDAAEWTGPAQRAGHGTAPLGPRDSALAVALLASAEQDSPTACRTLERLTERARDDFAAWFASADCLARDTVVVPDARSPTGWRFRSSMQAAQSRYQTAFSLMPSIMRGLRRNSFAEARSIFQVSRSILKRGVGLAPDTTQFVASLALLGDTLVELPQRRADYDRRDRPRVRGTRADVAMASAIARARARQREVFREVAAAWVADQRTAQGYEALGLALQWLGDPSALDTLDRARALATSDADRASIAVTSVIVGVLLGAPDDTSMLHRVALVADSLLSDRVLVRLDPRAAATVAALRGHAYDAARHASAVPGTASDGQSLALRRTVERLFTFSAFGGPIDTLQRLGDDVEAMLAREPVTTPGQRYQALRRSAVLALPIQLRAITTLEQPGDLVLSAAQSLLRQDRQGVRELLSTVSERRRDIPVEDLTFDSLLPEALMWKELGETPSAIALLDPALGALRRSAPNLNDLSHTVSLIRAMELRAELAAAGGDRVNARRWANAVLVLWGDCDDFLKPRMRRMRELVS